MPPDYPYSIHLTHPDSTYNFESYESVCYFLDTTHLLAKDMKVSMLHNFEAARTVSNPKNEFNDTTGVNAAFLIMFLGVLVFSYILSKTGNSNESSEKSAPAEPSDAENSQFVYKGCDLDFDTITLEIICLKYNAFFRTLGKAQQQLFLEKLQAFMKCKQFWMYGEDCYREMPVLLSATATQLSFGLPQFHLDSYPNICIQPQEYFGYEPLRILTGNVQGNTITVSWKHFLSDNLDADDGNNVGLHEMAHAFAMQLLYVPSEKHQISARQLRVFYEKLDEFVIYEKQKPASLFDAYSLQNADECWAKCIELFFEKGEEMQYYYPELYKGIKQILNQ
jgi:MtfA peptidase